MCEANDVKGSFRLRVDDAETGKGKVAYVPNPKFPPHDPDRSNDSAAIAVHATR